MLRKANETKRQIIESLNKRLLGEQDDLYRYEGGNIKGMIQDLEKGIDGGYRGGVQLVYDFLESHTWEDLLAMDKYFQSKKFVDTVGYIMEDFKEPHGSKEERDKVMDLIIKLMEASPKNPVNDDRYMYYFSQRHGIEDAGTE